MNGRSFAFLSFLDLISCAFGAAVLVFVVAATAGNPDNGSEVPDLMLIRAEHVAGASPEIEFRVRPPNGVPISTSRLSNSVSLGSDWYRITTEKNTNGGAFLVIPKPNKGDWELSLYWTDGNSVSNADYIVHCYCPGLNPEGYEKWNVGLTASERYGVQTIKFHLK